MQRGPSPDSWLTAGDFDSDGTELTIASVSTEEIEPNVSKTVVRFVEVQKGLVLNEINLRTIERNLDETEQSRWTGSRITLYSSSVTVKGNSVPCIRIKMPVKALSAKKRASGGSN